MAITGDFEAYLAEDWYGRPMSVAALLECEAEADIDMAVVMPDAKEDPDNDGLLKRTGAHPNLLPCVMMNPHWGGSWRCVAEGLRVPRRSGYEADGRDPQVRGGRSNGLSVRRRRTGTGHCRFNPYGSGELQRRSGPARSRRAFRKQR